MLLNYSLRDINTSESVCLVRSQNVSCEDVDDKGEEDDQFEQCEIQTAVEGTTVGSSPDNVYLGSMNPSQFKTRHNEMKTLQYTPAVLFDQLGKRLLPCVHLDDPHSRNNFIHQSDPLVCLFSCFQTKPRKNSTQTCYKIGIRNK